MAITIALSGGSTITAPSIDLVDFRNVWSEALKRNELISLDDEAVIHPGHIVAVR